MQVFANIYRLFACKKIIFVPKQTNLISYMSTTKTSSETMSNYRWIICSMLFFATAVNYLDRQVLSLTWKILSHQNSTGQIRTTELLLLSFNCLRHCQPFAGRFVDWLGSKKGISGPLPSGRSAPACTHFADGLPKWVWDLRMSMKWLQLQVHFTSTIAITSVYYFIAARHCAGRRWIG